jgi:predicted metalloendopeptidase
LDLMDQIIAYGDDLIDRELVDNVHKDIRISKDRFLDNALHLNKFWKDFQFSQLRVKVDPKTWLEHGDVSIVNAFYNDESNVIIFKAAFLQGVNFTNILRAAFLYKSFAQSFFCTCILG